MRADNALCFRILFLTAEAVGTQLTSVVRMSDRGFNEVRHREIVLPFGARFATLLVLFVEYYERQINSASGLRRSLNSESH